MIGRGPRVDVPRRCRRPAGRPAHMVQIASDSAQAISESRCHCHSQTHSYLALLVTAPGRRARQPSRQVSEAAGAGHAAVALARPRAGTPRSVVARAAGPWFASRIRYIMISLDYAINTSNYGCLPARARGPGRQLASLRPGRCHARACGDMQVCGTGSRGQMGWGPASHARGQPVKREASRVFGRDV